MRSSPTRTESRSAAGVVDNEDRASASRRKFAGKRVHFIGIGGSGMSGLAAMLIDDGAIVTGSEPNPNPQTRKLTARGATIVSKQTGDTLDRSIDLVVRTAAVPDTNPEFLKARELGIRTVKYAQMLGEVMAERFGVAVAGTHGKSTTTAMISYALVRCGAEPSFVIGGTVPQLGGGSRSGKGDLFVAEACEYDRSFHNLRPRVAVITNIEEDHLDCYTNIHAINESFRHFAQIVPQDGLIITSSADANVTKALQNLQTPIERCALVEERGHAATNRSDAAANRSDAADPLAWSTKVTGIVNGCHTGDVYHNGTKVCALRLSIPGKHNLINATMAVAACNACGVSPAQSAEAIATFTGVDRRMTEVGHINGALVVDDYGHHPTEIRATLSALRERYAPTRLICVFQPHQHSRTRFLLEAFATSFAAADETILADIYFVRDSEADRQTVSSADLVKKISANGQRALHLPEFAQIVQHLKAHARDGDLIVTMGAGNVCEIGRELVAG